MLIGEHEPFTNIINIALLNSASFIPWNIRKLHENYELINETLKQRISKESSSIWCIALIYQEMDIQFWRLNNTIVPTIYSIFNIMHVIILQKSIVRVTHKEKKILSNARKRVGMMTRIK